MSTTLHRLCNRDELESGKMKAFQIGKTRLVLCRHGEAFAALRNICSHHQAQLSQGLLGGTNVASEVGEYKYGRDGEVLRCPRHGFEFDINTGRSLHDPEHQRVKVYTVVTKDEEVYVELAD
jgi:nitrite reductase/ring-hydroxylating ferredoxin subunit